MTLAESYFGILKADMDTSSEELLATYSGRKDEELAIASRHLRELKDILCNLSLLTKAYQTLSDTAKKSAYVQELQKRLSKSEFRKLYTPERHTLVCKRCKHEWKTKGKHKPKYCPKCHSPYWNKEKLSVLCCCGECGFVWESHGVTLPKKCPRKYPAHCGSRKWAARSQFLMEEAAHMSKDDFLNNNELLIKGLENSWLKKRGL